MDGPNSVTPEQFKALKARFSGKLEPEEARAVLLAAGDDKSVPPIVRPHIATALLDLRTGRSVQSTMARLRRATGLDPERKRAE